MKKCLHQKVLASAITLFLSLVIIVSSISVFAEGNSEIVFPETTASLSGGWGSGASNPTYSANGKSFTLSASPTSSGYTAQFQCLMYIDNFSSILKNSKKIAFDFYPTFTNQNGADSCWLKYSFDQVNWSGDFANPLKNGEKYTLVIDTSSVPSNASFIALQFQNYGNQISSDAVIIGSAPYIYEAGTAEPTTPGTTQPSQSGEGFDPNTIFQNKNCFTGHSRFDFVAFGNYSVLRLSEIYRNSRYSVNRLQFDFKYNRSLFSEIFSGKRRSRNRYKQCNKSGSFSRYYTFLFQKIENSDFKTELY